MDTKLQTDHNRPAVQTLQVLLIADDPGDARQIHDTLAHAPAGLSVRVNFNLARAGRLDTGLSLMAERKYDAVLLDLSLPDGNGMANLGRIRSQSPGIPMIVLGESNHPAVALEALQEGAQEYLVKGESDGATLIRSIQSAITRQHVRETLLKSKEHLENVLDSAAEAVIALDETQKIILFNKAAEQIFGYRSEEIAGQPLDMLLPEQFVEAHREHVYRFAAESTRVRRMSHRSDIFGRRKDGTEFPMQAGISKLQREGQTIFTVILEDVTERKRNEQALIASEARYRRMFEESERQREFYNSVVNNMSEGLCVAGPDGRINFVNAKLGELLGRTSDELVGQPYSTILAPRERERAMQVTAPRPKGAASLCESTLIAQDGREIPVLVSAIPYRQEGQVAGTLVTFTDTTERKRSEETRALLASIVESSDDAILSKDLNGTILSWNRGAESLYGYSAAEVIGRDVSVHVPPELKPEVRVILDRIKRGERVARYETVRVRKNGERVDVSLTLSPILDETGRIVGASSIAHDISARKRSEDRIQQQLRKITALRDIDVAITSSLDVRLTLNVLLDQVTHQLDVDAAAVLLLDQHTQMLEYAASRGFRMNSSTRTPLRVGDGFAGRAALERKTIFVPDLAHVLDRPGRPRWNDAEGFTTYFGVPLIAKGQCRGVLEVFSRESIAPNAEWLDFLQTLAGQGAIAIDSASLFNDLQVSNADLARAYDTTLEGWSRALDLRDKETEGHTQRVTEMTLRLARVMGLSDAEMIHLRRGSLLHDIGKMGIPDSILLKPGGLSEMEWTVMRLHPVYAYEMLMPISYLKSALDIPYCHHEKWDGSGYPRGLMGEQIPLVARAFAVVDVWDALRSDRPYRSAWSKEQVAEHIASETGKHFDPRVVPIFLDLKTQGEI